MPNRENLSGPLVEGARLSKRLIDFLHRLDDGQQTATATATAAQETAQAASDAVASAPPVSITGANEMVRVYGDSSSGFTVEGNRASVMARISLGF